MKNASWIVCHDARAGDLAYAMECLHCGAVQRFALPIDVSVYVAAGKAFEKIHRRCPAPDPTVAAAGKGVQP